MDIDLEFILQIVLTIAAFFRGWKWKALIPLVVGFTLGFIVPTLSGGQEPSWFQSFVTVYNIVVIIALVVMIIKPINVKKSK